MKAPALLLEFYVLFQLVNAPLDTVSVSLEIENAVLEIENALVEIVTERHNLLAMVSLE